MSNNHELLAKIGVHIKNGHFVNASGRHSAEFVDEHALYPHPTHVLNFCGQIAKHFGRHYIHVVAGAGVGGGILAHATAHELTKGMDSGVFAVYAEKHRDKTKGFRFAYGYDGYLRHGNVLIVKDIITNGENVRELVKVARECGGHVVGVGALFNCGSSSAVSLGVPNLFSMVRIEMPSWSEEDCPLCRDGVPVNEEVGKGREYLAKKAATQNG